MRSSSCCCAENYRMRCRKVLSNFCFLLLYQNLSQRSFEHFFYFYFGPTQGNFYYIKTWLVSFLLTLSFGHFFTFTSSKPNSWEAATVGCCAENCGMRCRKVTFLRLWPLLTAKRNHWKLLMPKSFANIFFTFTFRFLNSDFYFIRTLLSAHNSEHKHKDECQAETRKTFETERARAKRKTAIFSVFGQVHSYKNELVRVKSKE